MSDPGTGLREHLVAARIAGPVRTTRENNLGNLARMAAGEPLYTFGLQFGDRWSYDRVFALMVERVGIDPDPAYAKGEDRIDPDRTIAALDRMRDRLAGAAARRERVLVATGHPAGVHAIHAGIAAALAAAGCAVLEPAPGAAYLEDSDHGPRRRGIRHIRGVAMASNGGGLTHTHSPEPMRVMLAALVAAGEPPPDLVVADHGFAGAAGQAGIDAVGFADCNDPALFVGEAEGRIQVAVPLDDNVLPHRYAPVTAHLLAGWT